MLVVVAVAFLVLCMLRNMDFNIIHSSHSQTQRATWVREYVFQQIESNRQTEC